MGSESWVDRIYRIAERSISAVILAGMLVVVILAVWSFLRTLMGVLSAGDAALDYAEFQTLFDRVLAALIAVELAHSIRQLVLGDHGLGQLRVVIVIGMLAVTRKLIVLEVEDTSNTFLLGIAAVVAALAAGLVAVRWAEIAGRDRVPEA